MKTFKICFYLLSASIALAADGPADWKLRLQTSNAAELQLLTGLENDLAIARNAVTKAEAETATVQKAGDQLKAERDRNAGIASRAVEQVKELTAFSEQMHAWDGGGAIAWGVKRLFFHAMLALAGLAAVLTVLSIFFPPVGAFLGIVGRNLLSLAVRRVTT